MEKATFIERVLRGRFDTFEEERTEQIERCWETIEERANFLYSEIGRGLIESRSQARQEWLAKFLEE